MEAIRDFLQKREKEGLLRSLRQISLRRKGKIYFDKEEYIDFSSNDYLGLSGHPKLLEEAKNALDRFGTGACASRLMSGSLELHWRLEEETARFKGKEAALVFNSGYQANIGIISALYAKGDCIFSDRLNHASIVDGIILSRAACFRFRHNDVEHLRGLLGKERNKFRKALIITESVFSMDGDIAPLRQLVDLKEKYNCAIFVDEAHSTGVFGKGGAGVIEEQGLGKKIDFIMGTFSKALAGFGAYIASSREKIAYLVNTSRCFIYSTALPPSVIACNLKSIDLVKQEPHRKSQLLESAEYFRNSLKENDFQVKGSSQIVPLIIGDNSKAINLAKKLQKKGYWVLPIRAPTVPLNQARLRFSLTFYHNKNILRKLVKDICESGI